MLQGLSAPRRWAISRSPIAKPPTAEIDVAGLVATLHQPQEQGVIDLPMLEPPELDQQAWVRFSTPVVTRDYAGMTTDVADFADGKESTAASTTASTVTAFTPLAPALTIHLRLESILFSAPAIIALFEALQAPGKAGKAYAAAAPKPVQRELIEVKSQERCKHGMIRSMCTTCQEEAARRRTRRTTAKQAPARTVDVFDLLLPYLQPSIQELLAQPLLFPADKSPHPYQVTGIKFMAERTAALLGDEMGLGKTIQAIVALQVLYRRGDARQTLILCPRSLLGTWQRELAKWAPELYVLRVRGSKDERAALWQAPAAVYLTTYETLRNDQDEIPGLATKFQVMLLDEVQKIKNATTENARAVRRVRANVRWALSGTPLENKLEDVVAIFGYLKPGLFRADDALTPEMVQQRIAPYFLRRRTADVRQDLPEKMITEVWLDLTDAQARAYQQAEEAGKLDLVKAGATRVHVFALINKLKQICNMDVASGESCKADYLEDELENIVGSGQKALVFSHLPRVSLKQIEPRLKSFGTAIFDGSLSDSRREQIIQAFMGNGQPNVMLMSVQAGGVGLTLTAANHVFHFDHWWNPAVARQAEGRAHRIGQERTVFVHDLYTTGTIEERIHTLLQEKQSLFDAVIDNLSAEYVERAITDDELFGLFGMKPPTAEAPATRPVRTYGATTSQPRAQRLDDLSPREFERHVARIYEAMGFRVDVTSQSRDHGIDVIGRRPTEFGVEKIIVQCKHYPTGVVGEAAVRDLIGAWREHPDAQIAVIVTSGRFSQDAIAFAQRHRVSLRDQSDLKHMAAQYLRRKA